MADDNRNDGRNNGQRGYDPYARRRAALVASAQEDPLAELARLIGQQNESGSPVRQSPARIGHDSEAQPGWPALPGLSGKSTDRYRQQQDVPDPYTPDPYTPDPYAADPYAADPYDQDRQGGYGQGKYGHGSAGSHSPAAPYAAAPSYSDRSYDSQSHDPSDYDDRYVAAPTYGVRPDDRNPVYVPPRYADDAAYGDAGRSYSAPHAGEAGYQDGYGYTDPRYAVAADPHAAYADRQYAQDAHGAYDQGYDRDAYAQEAYAQPGYSQGGYHQGAYAAQDGAAYAAAGDGRFAVGHPASFGAGKMPKSGRFPISGKRGGMVTVLAVMALAVVGTAGAFGYRATFGGPGTSGPPPVIKADPNPTKIVPATDASAKPIQDRIGGERLVSREEQPIQMPDPARAGAPRVIFPHTAGVDQDRQISSNIASTGTGANEPRRIRTVAIRPDGTVDSAAARQTGPSASRSAVPFAEPDPAAVRAQPVPPSANAPLALTPSEVPVPQPQPQRQAARTPSNGSPFPAPITGSANPVAGGFAVQVSSQRSEAEAQASFRSLQQRFPAVLGNREPMIRRADLGEKGVYYRAQVPFGSQAEASEFCSSLKAAGGQCVVQRN